MDEILTFGICEDSFKRLFPENPSTLVDLHQQFTGMNANQNFEFAKAVGLEASLATFGVLEGSLLKICGKTGRGAGSDRVGVESHLPLARLHLLLSRVLSSFLFTFCLVSLSQLVATRCQIFATTHIVVVVMQMRPWVSIRLISLTLPVLTA